MSAEAKPTSHTMLWMALTLGFLLLYFLSVPWVRTFTNWHPSLGGAWVRSYEAPFFFTLRHSPQGVRHLISQYDAWCRGKMGFGPLKI